MRALVRRLLGGLLRRQSRLDVSMDIHEHLDGEPQSSDYLCVCRGVAVGNYAGERYREHGAEVAQFGQHFAQNRRDGVGVSDFHIEPSELNSSYASILSHAVPLSELNQHLARQFPAESMRGRK